MQACYAAWKTREVESLDYEVLVNQRPLQCKLHWSPLEEDGSLPPDALKTGLDNENLQLIYAVRARPPIDGVFGTHCGQIKETSESIAQISYDGKVYDISNGSFKVLCREFVHEYSRKRRRPFTC